MINATGIDVPVILFDVQNDIVLLSIDFVNNKRDFVV